MLAWKGVAFRSRSELGRSLLFSLSALGVEASLDDTGSPFCYCWARVMLYAAKEQPKPEEDDTGRMECVFFLS